MTPVTPVNPVTPVTPVTAGEQPLIAGPADDVVRRPWKLPVTR